jgi:DNA-binding CsgD family transcriptional regulator
MSSSPHLVLSASRFSEFNALALNLQRLAQECTLDSFHDTAMRSLQEFLGFDKAWWGRTAMIDGLPHERSSHLFHLPDHYVDDWKSIRDQDITVGRAFSSPGQSVCINTGADDCPAGLRWLAQSHGFGEFLCIVHVDPQTQLCLHLSLYRQVGAKPFDEQDMFFVDQLMPHLIAADGLNQIRALVALRERLDTPNPLALAVCDRHAMLHYAEAGFIALMLREWPAWSGPCLPDEIEPAAGHSGQHIQLQATAVHDLFLLSIRPSPAIACLSLREAEVAQRFGGGSTYKEIARDLGLAPNTVRHHIRGIYSKLGINDKTGIAQLLQHPPD